MEDATEAGFLRTRVFDYLYSVRFWGKMKLPIKKMLLASVLTIGAFLAFIFVFGSLDPIQNNIARQPAIPRFETLPKAASVLSTTNITSGMAKQIAQEIVAQNPDGPNAGEQAGLRTIDPELLAKQAIEEAFQDIHIEDLRPVVKLADLTIIKSNEKSLAEEYFKNLNRIIAKNFPVGVSVNWENPATTNFSVLINAYALSMSESMAVAVPEELAELHQRYVSLLGAERNTLTIIKNYSVDPAQATVAIEAGNLFTRELESVLKTMNSYIASHKLVLAA